MAIQVLMPALSPTMEKGNLAKWIKREGDKVKSGDVIAEIETDKATMEVEAVDEGTLGKILVPEGTADVAVNTPIAVILGDGEDASAADAVKPAQQQKAAESAPPAAKPASTPAEPKSAAAAPPQPQAAPEPDVEPAPVIPTGLLALCTGPAEEPGDSTQAAAAPARSGPTASRRPALGNTLTGLSRSYLCAYLTP